MTSQDTPEAVFRKLVNGVAEGRRDELPALYAEKTDVRHPFSPYGDEPLVSRDALRRHFGSRAPGNVSYRPANIRVHQTADPEVIVAEFDYAGQVPATGEPFAVPCVFVMRVRDGLIVESRDYIDHVAFAKARGQVDHLIDVLTG